MLPGDPDNNLTIVQKLELLKWIPIRQKQRWERLKFWHSNSRLKMSHKHFFMRAEIDMIRQERARFIKLQKEVLT